jgi:aspartate/methionine/tyrosine aminotransferase
MAEVTTSKPALAVAERMRGIGFSEIAQVREQIAALREQGGDVYELHGGEPFFETPADIKSAAKTALDENRTRYPPIAGIARLREALAAKLMARNRIAATPDHVLPTNGGIHGLFIAFQATLSAGDEVLVFSPFWTPIQDLVLLAQARPVLVNTWRARQAGFAAALRTALTSRTRAIYYNTPQNPTGMVFTHSEAEEVAQFAIEHNLVVVSDEAYEDLVYDGEHVSIASLAGMLERTISCFTFSKSYSMTGWRAGYAVAAEPWMTALRKLLLYSTTGLATPTQWAVLAAVQSPPELLARRREEFRERRELLVTGLRSAGIAIEAPAGAFYAFPDVSRIARASREAANLLLHRARVSSVPGIVFGPEGEGHVRMTFSAPMDVLEKAVASIKAHL